MTYDEVMSIVRSSPYSEWKHNDTKGIFTLRKNVNIYIKKVERENEPKRFSEPWANNHPDPDAYRLFYEIYYGASFIDDFMLVSVDGCRADLPLPEPGTNVILKKNYLLARAVDHTKRLEEYIKSSKLSVNDSV